MNRKRRRLLPRTASTSVVSARFTLVAALVVGVGCSGALSDPAEGNIGQEVIDPGDNTLSIEPFVSATNGWGPAERDHSNGETLAGDGHTLSMGGKLYARGFGVHAPSRLVFKLDRRCTAFRSAIGIDDEVGSRGSVLFQVYADGVKLFDSDVLGGSSATGLALVDLTGRSQLELVVTDAGDGTEYDHADWASPQVTCTSASAPPPVVSPDPTHEVQIQLETANLSSVAAGATVDLTYHWSGGPTSGPRQVFVHALDGAGQIAFQDDHTPPVDSSQWTGGAYSYTRTVTVPAHVAPGTLALWAGLFDPITGQRETLGLGAGVQVDGDHRYRIGTVEVTSAALPALGRDPVTGNILSVTVPTDGQGYDGSNLQDKQVAFTFDDGPNCSTMPRLLDVLKEQGVYATFLVIGQNVAHCPAVLQRAVAEGHSLGGHSYSHPDLSKLTYSAAVNEIRTGLQAEIGALGSMSRLFRYPYAGSTPELNAYLQQNHIGILFWKMASEDYNGITSDEIYNKTMAALGQQHRGVILNHDLSTTLAAMPRIFTELRAQGYHTVRLKSGESLIASTMPQ